MMSCDICHDTGGPFEITEYKNKVVLACEDCIKKYNKKNKIKSKSRKANNYYEYSMKR